MNSVCALLAEHAYSAIVSPSMTSMNSFLRPSSLSLPYSVYLAKPYWLTHAVIIGLKQGAHNMTATGVIVFAPKQTSR